MSGAFGQASTGVGTRVLFGFHAVGVRIKTSPASVHEIYFDPSRRDVRMKHFLHRAQESQCRLIEADGQRLAKLCGSHGHQGVAARVDPVEHAKSLDDLLDDLIDVRKLVPLLLVLDGVTDPHNLGACLRVADAAGAHAVIAPKDHAVGLNATVAKVASGAAETMPYFMVTNLARTLNELKDRSIWCVGASDDAQSTLYQTDFKVATALVLGAEGAGMRQLTRKTCDSLVRIPMLGAVESLNVSVASGVCLYEAARQRGFLGLRA
jgi:23S rRNA (guanosine2251-2'-O)-methyltransferase